MPYLMTYKKSYSAGNGMNSGIASILFQSISLKPSFLFFMRCTNFKMASTNLNMPSTKFKTTSTNLNMPSTKFKTTSTNLNMPSTNLKMPSTEFKMTSTNFKMVSTNLLLEFHHFTFKIQLDFPFTKLINK